MEYVGIQTIGNKSSNFSEIKAMIAATLNNNNIRSRRRLSIIFKALKVRINKIQFEISLNVKDKICTLLGIK